MVRLHRYCRDRGIRYRIEYMSGPRSVDRVSRRLRHSRRQRRRLAARAHGNAVDSPADAAPADVRRGGDAGISVQLHLRDAGPGDRGGGIPGLSRRSPARARQPVARADFFLAAFVFGIVLSVAAIALEEQTFRRYPRSRDLAGLFVLAIRGGARLPAAQRLVAHPGNVGRDQPAIGKDGE